VTQSRDLGTRLVQSPCARHRRRRLVWRCRRTSGHGRRLCIVIDCLNAGRMGGMGRLVEISRLEPCFRRVPIDTRCSGSLFVRYLQAWVRKEKQSRCFLTSFSFPHRSGILAFERPQGLPRSAFQSLELSVTTPWQRTRRQLIGGHPARCYERVGWGGN
jgi:hypothetical protein